MYVLVGLGANGEYLDIIAASLDEDFLDKMFMSFCDIMDANIAGTLPLQERLKLAPFYFPGVGRLQSVEFVHLAEKMLPALENC
jgi:hypothetical protein